MTTEPTIPTTPAGKALFREILQVVKCFGPGSITVYDRDLRDRILKIEQEARQAALPAPLREALQAGVAVMKRLIRLDVIPEGRRELADQWMLDVSDLLDGAALGATPEPADSEEQLVAWMKAPWATPEPASPPTGPLFDAETTLRLREAGVLWEQIDAAREGRVYRPATHEQAPLVAAQLANADELLSGLHDHITSYVIPKDAQPFHDLIWRIHHILRPLAGTEPLAAVPATAAPEREHAPDCASRAYAPYPDPPEPCDCGADRDSPALAAPSEPTSGEPTRE